MEEDKRRWPNMTTSEPFGREAHMIRIPSRKESLSVSTAPPKPKQTPGGTDLRTSAIARPNAAESAATGGPVHIREPINAIMTAFSRIARERGFDG